MRRLLRDLIEGVLPWYQPTVEHKRNARTARVVARSERARAHAERVIDQYRRAESSAATAGELLVNEVRR